MTFMAMLIFVVFVVDSSTLQISGNVTITVIQHQGSTLYFEAISGVVGNPMAVNFSFAVSHRSKERFHNQSLVVQVGTVLCQGPC